MREARRASGGSILASLVMLKIRQILNIECKCYNKKSVYDEDWMEKVQAEVPLHSDKLAIVATLNKNDKFRVHLDGDDFFRMYIELYKYRQGIV
jgi:hypothetical protein